MKALLSSVALAAIPLSGLMAPPASAQLFGGGIVYDPTNHAENILQAVRALQQIDNQIRQLTHEIDMIEKMARDLETLPVEVARAIIADRIRRIGELMEEADGIGYGVEEVERDYEDLYPETYGETPPANAVLVEDARARWQQSRSAHKHTLLMVAETVRDNARDAEALTGLVEESQTAIGNLQVLQAGNQIEAMSAQQLMQMEAMMAAHYRAEALDRARELEEAERGRARLQSFFGN
ncbi:MULTISPECIES: P-type conjugative transfer protein TrbJ [Hyphomonas]|jgi:P-type conjugative transfer protein TrbJ|uniref:Conjugal transfer protein TrbJ n=1 Tax=Hyphomonas pacifica TaxID=1280941 RepID=A0A062TYK1_9PROT|nr:MULTISPECIES: P-type conjugative transfer protein TrbJ [Hyphomonas]KCZ47299.1 conjugal transfer protein TrbJ [Hyphomonas pacifica]QSR22107.1 conjugal transfer protein TrbJ [Hyphomonas sp. KY3]RAN31386.1 conjugal transfer protein TrbJ [Hyphomonas pacifica]